MSMTSATGSEEAIEILLSTYNGSEYLDAFLESVLNQDYPSWAMTVRDDGSSDSTVEILHAWQARVPGRIRLIDEGTANLGHVRSFSRLLECSTGRYVMFADQDDVWLPSKVRLTMDAMRLGEQKSATPRPIVVHTDAVLVDKALRPLGGTSWSSQGFWPTRRSIFQRVMVENIVMGCTAMLNRPLIDLIETIPADAVYHDWWIALVASAFGEIISVKEPLLLWRRHGSNESEMSNLSYAFRLCVTNPRAGRRRLTKILNESRPRVAAFLQRYRSRLQSDQVSAAEAFVNLPEKGFVARRIDILRHGLFFVVPLRNVGLLTLI